MDKTWSDETSSTQVRAEVNRRIIDWAGSFGRFDLRVAPFGVSTVYTKSGPQNIAAFDYLSIQESSTLASSDD